MIRNTHATASGRHNHTRVCPKTLTLSIQAPVFDANNLAKADVVQEQVSKAEKLEPSFQGLRSEVIGAGVCEIGVPSLGVVTTTILLVAVFIFGNPTVVVTQ